MTAFGSTMSVVDACESLGVAHSSYYRKKRHAEEGKRTRRRIRYDEADITARIKAVKVDCLRLNHAGLVQQAGRWVECVASVQDCRLA